MKNLIPFLALSMGLGCGGDDSSSADQVFSSDPPLVVGADERPADVDIPTDYDPAGSYPLLMVLHGHGADGKTQTGWDEGIDAALWTVNDAGHIPFFTTEFADLTTDWLLRHSR